MCAFRILLISTLLWVGGCKTGKTPQPEQAPVKQQIHFNNTEDYDPYPSVGSIMDEQGLLIGSGVLVRSDVVLTAAHVVCSGRSAFSFFVGEENILIEFIILHPNYDINDNTENDIALVFLACDSIYPPVQLHQGETLTRGKLLTVVGYSGGSKRYSSFGTFWYYGTLIDQPSQIKWLAIEATVWFGDSGGGVFCYFGGEEKLIGVVSNLSTYKNRAYENSATSISYFYDWIMEELNERMVTKQNSSNDDNKRRNYLR